MKILRVIILFLLPFFSHISKADYDHCAVINGIILGDKLANQIEILRETLEKSGARIFMKEVDGKIIPVVVVNSKAFSSLNEKSSGLVDAEWLLIDKKSLKTNFEKLSGEVYSNVYAFASIPLTIAIGISTVSLSNHPLEDPLSSAAVAALNLFLFYKIGSAKDKRVVVSKSTGIKNLKPKQALKSPDGYIFDLQTQEFLREANIPLLVVNLKEEDPKANSFSPANIKNPDSTLNRSLREVGLKGATEISMERFVEYLNSIKRATPDLIVQKDISPLTHSGSDAAGVYIERIESSEGFNFDSFTFLVDAIRSKGFKFSISGFMREASSISIIYGMPRDENGNIISTKFTIPIGILATSIDTNGKAETRVYLPMVENEIQRQKLMDRVYYVMGKTELMSDKSAAENFKKDEEAFVEVNKNIRTMQQAAAKAFEDRERKILNPDGPTQYTHEFLDRLLKTSGEVEKGREQTTFEDDIRQMRQ